MPERHDSGWPKRRGMSPEEYAHALIVFLGGLAGAIITAFLAGLGD